MKQVKGMVLASVDCAGGGVGTACVEAEVGAGQRAVCRGCEMQGAALLGDEAR